MLALWMVQASMVAALFGGAALLLERVCRERGRPGRWVWAGALALSLAVPPVTALMPDPDVPVSMAPVSPEPASLAPLAPFAVLSGIDDRAVPLLERMERPLLALWTSASLALLALGLLSWLRLGISRSGWREMRVEGTPVLVSRDTGPAVVGLLRHRIVLPEWVLAESPSARSLIVAHEREHVGRRDPLLVLLGALPALLFPWNAALWWQLRRLRLAVELDCDRRVLGEAAAPVRRRYGQLLLEVAEQGGRSPAGRLLRGAPLVAAFSERRSLLETRIREISRTRSAPAVRRMVGWAASGVVLGVVACLVPGPDASLTGPSGSLEEAPETLGLEVSEEPTFTPFTVRPRLVNVDAVRDALDRAYAPALRAAGVGGRTLLWFFIDETGLPRYVRLDQTSGHDELDRAAVAVGRVMRFTPALNRDQAVPVWVKLPVVFDPAEASRAGRPTPESSGASAAGEAPEDVIAELRREAGETDREPAAAAPAAGGAVQEAPRFTPFTVRPELLDVEAVSEALEAAYPPLLREAGIGGSPVVWFFIDAGGVVREARINRSSGHPALDEAALKVARAMGFTPALNGNDPVEVWVSLPITFGPR